MQLRHHVSRVRRGLRKPPRVIARRLVDETRAQLERRRAPGIGRRFDERALLSATGSSHLGELWDRLAARPYVAEAPPLAVLREHAPGEPERIRAAAADAARGRVDLLGSGPVDLGTPIDWMRDHKSGFRWEHGYARALEVAHLDKPNDVKWPWELSRMQWLVPAGQAYLLDRDEELAAATRDTIDSWIAANPYAWTVNWACTMDVALRAISWTWLFHAFARSDAWADPGFRARFLASLHLHGRFTERNLERTDVNGNHYTANAAGLVFTGLFFGAGAEAERWAELGWRILEGEIALQIHDDGVDFEASSAYHRLVTELFLLPALYRLRAGLAVPVPYAERLRAAARFVAAYARPDGLCPLWGDADDARTLPFGGQALNDHRYLIGLVAAAFEDEDLARLDAGPRDELVWLRPEAVAPIGPPATPRSASFPDGGVWVLRNERDHVFVDCGPIGLAGRGGHGHNDCLSFEAVLDGVPLVTDCGSYLYTASVEWRNRFRATAAHNTPLVDREEQNRFVAPDHLWTLVDDATPDARSFEPGSDSDRLVVAHGGYERLARPVRPVRTFVLDHGTHRLRIADAFEGDGDHELRVPFHFAPGVLPTQAGPGHFSLVAGDRVFEFTWSDAADWRAEVREAWWSPSYGVKEPIACVELVRAGPLRPLEVEIGPLP